MERELTPSQVLAAAAEGLSQSGYFEVPSPHVNDGLSRVFEDSYGVVMVQVFESWPALTDGWPQAQGALVELLSSVLLQPEAKAWEGYLVLMTPGHAGQDRLHEVTELRYDTRRVRKIVATGESISTLRDVATALLPLLPIEAGTARTPAVGLMELLPDLLEASGVDPDVTQAAIGAFIGNRSIVEAIHSRGDR
jgi:hypothetical protein